VKAAVYLRVSSKDGRQDEANQEPECVRLCTSRGWEAEVFRERESGAKDRPVWRSVIEAARLGSVGAVVFWALDRAGRNRVQVAHDLGELFRFRVHVASVKDSWLDVGSGPLRDLLVQVMAWVAQGERDRLIERTKAGLARARAQGKVLGRPRVSGDALVRAVAKVRLGVPVATAAREAGVARSTLRAVLAKKGDHGALMKMAERLDR
jgi:DNA invertase Pin-like site-specific DNA recombinase